MVQVNWSPNGRLLAFAGDENQFKVMDTVFWAEVESANQKNASSSPSNSSGKSRFPSVLSFSQDGKFLARACGKQGTRVMNTTTFDVIFNLQSTFAEPEDDDVENDKRPDSDGSDISSPTGSLTE